MFVVMFEFVVKAGQEQAFMAAWGETTQGIYLFKGSLGSRLHRDKSGAFIAYAQWPDEKTYREANDINMSDGYEKARDAMRSVLDLDATRVLFEMEVETDYLQRRPFAL